MMSMTADVCDLDELKTGERREGTIGAVYWWMVKFGGAFAGLLSGLIMTFVGFDEKAVTESALTGMRLAYTFLPIAAHKQQSAAPARPNRPTWRPCANPRRTARFRK